MDGTLWVLFTDERRPFMTREITDEDAVMDQIAERLAARFPSTPIEQISAVVREAHLALAGAHVRDFVPVLVEREATSRLKSAAT
ncbi:hypothetical protein MIC448_1990008 [Microbacterium sp. C448]|jgi:hypothetical protein|uniref:three-helix bundle dimerization domain-containing protein n=2 Tax=Microbacterium TaxID=33882 RepID=UPI0003DE5AC4|nr:hypothetical protein [Microbacterium sp. C448]CDJ99965.1 hypothetical protein MIC448_1990008 [Microbacterium sp. C448]|tara:strand:- start:375 stop:629 length:255 start_codon:yes stop_codon:yes gene_type:complete